MDYIFELVPKSKSDILGIEKLKSIEPGEAEPILESLMEWMQDINWPVAHELIKVLPRFHIQLIPVIRNIFKTDDDIWKYWTLELLKSFPRETLFMLQSEIERMAKFPTDGEKTEEVDINANEILSLISF